LRYINYLNDEGSIETLKSFRDVRKYLTPKIRNGTLEKPAKMKVEEYLEIGQYCRGLLSILCLQACSYRSSLITPTLLLEITILELHDFLFLFRRERMLHLTLQL
jgi:hypothetical protein